MREEKKKKQKQRQEQKQRKRQEANSFREFWYNCPYVTAVVATSLAVMVCSDEIGIKALAREAQGVVVQTMTVNGRGQETSAYLTAGEGSYDEGNTGQRAADMADNFESAGERKQESNENTDENNLNIDMKNEENAEISDKEPVGITKFESYEPQETDSIYYKDAGKIALTTEYPYVKENDSYFDDAAFLGDSRTLGISDYAGLNMADFYCDSGMMIFKILEEEVTYQKTGEKVNLPEVLTQKQYGKIYIMLGMNELGYGNTETYLEQYRKVVDQIREWQPDAVVYIMANLHVSREKNNIETEFNNININDKNVASASLANGKDIFYLDANPLFTDEEGFMSDELTFDGVHLYAQHYDVWREFLLEHGVETKKNNNGL